MSTASVGMVRRCQVPGSGYPVIRIRAISILHPAYPVCALGSVLGARYPALGVDSAPVPGTRSQVPDSRYPIPGTRYLAPVFEKPAHGVCILYPASIA
jgi:hypothetical protein